MTSIRHEIHCTINSLFPFDEMEQKHISCKKHWIESGAEIFRTAKPARPDPHLVAYCLLVDSSANQVLLVDHKKTGLWLLAGRHFVTNEHPKGTLKRKINEKMHRQSTFFEHSREKGITVY